MYTFCGLCRKDDCDHAQHPERYDVKLWDVDYRLEEEWYLRVIAPTRDEAAMAADEFIWRRSPKPEPDSIETDTYTREHKL